MAMSIDDGAERDIPLTPDFIDYPMDPPLSQVSVEEGGKTLGIAWADGYHARFHAIWLRDNASDPENLNLETREVLADVTAIPPDIAIVSAVIDAAGGLCLTWNEDRPVSRFHPGWLRSHDYSNPREVRDPQDMEPILWDGRAFAEPPSVDGSQILQDDGVLTDWLTAIARYGVARLTSVSPEEDMVGRVVERIGPVRATTFGRLFHVKVNPGLGPGSNAYTTLGLTPHTDLPTREYQPGLQFLHCLANSASGGAGVMVDGYAVAKAILEADPAAYETLTTVALPHSNRATDSDYRWRSPVLRLNDRDEVREVRAGGWVRAPLDLPFDQVEEAYRALRVFFATARDPRFAARITYRPGDLIAMDNRRLLHGRKAYDQGTGERWLQGCYGEREELYSRLRVLTR
ncbi:MAG: TauD/TfdA family dioxygenase [Alphaproteobacteria bacterium]|nr:TauD/TfdA family dioxygenase [Alphaproteobacteria bacterium]